MGIHFTGESDVPLKHDTNKTGEQPELKGNTVKSSVMDIVYFERVIKDMSDLVFHLMTISKIFCHLISCN